MTRQRVPFWAAIWAAVLLPALASGEQSEDFGEYVVHYNALQTDALAAKVAREYKIKRSRNRVMLNIVVQHKQPDQSRKAVVATVTSSATNLTGQVKTIEMRQIQEGDAIYYIGVTNVADKETLNFTVKVAPENSSLSKTVRFRKQFFTR